MNSKSINKYRIINSVSIGVVSCVISIAFAFLGVFDSTLQGIITAGAIGLFCGLTISLFESWSAVSFIKRLALPVNMLIRFLFYTFILFVANSAGYSIKYTGSFSEIMFSVINDPAFNNSIIFSIVLSALFNTSFTFISLIGQKVLLNLLLGRYHHPKEEELIFMFLDIKGSTTIAEKIGHLRFINLLNDFFYDMSEAIMLAKAEIYKYVGDEIILVWKFKQGFLNANCVRLFFLHGEKIQSRKDYYRNVYGLVPDFKAGLHGGKVVTGELGAIKTEIGYFGDVLNTTARIESLCNEKCEGLLVSGDLLALMELPAEYEKVPHGDIVLRGKEKPVAVYGVKKRAD
ncbi:MAG: hypothetical protein A2Y33_13670 [Spirochaetes bacterium GWF1_51_8]|nr:MAG: hypothetical protein A2Y33_13670 [Spirochaetes bacterium GWF1_51_8]